MKLEIFSDVVCPWCNTGKHRLDQAVANLTQTGIDLKLGFTAVPTRQTQN